MKLCLYPKQPFTNIAISYLDKISSLPGMFLALMRYLNPWENNNFRTKISGFVFI